MRALLLLIPFLAGISSVHAREFDLGRLLRGPAPNVEIAGTCTLDREAISGSEKFCYYNCIDGEKTVKIGASEFCPLDMD